MTRYHSMLLSSSLMLLTILGGNLAHADDQDGARDEGRRQRPGQNQRAGQGQRDGQQARRPGQNPQRARNGRPGDAPANDARPGQNRGMMQMDPQRVASKMLETFDKDGDQKLNVSELTALLEELRQNRGAMMRGAGAPDDNRQRRMQASRDGSPGSSTNGNAGDRTSGSQRRMRDSKRNVGYTQGAESGGDKPKRPGK